MDAKTVFHGSDGALTRRYYALLEACGLDGVIAMTLMRAAKSSTRAKRYRGRLSPSGPKYRDLAYNKKQWSLGELVTALSTQHTLPWGWGVDLQQSLNRHVLYVDLPTGQCSFHSPVRGAGPDYLGQWDGLHESEAHLLAFCERVLAESVSTLPLLTGGLASVPAAVGSARDYSQ